MSQNEYLIAEGIFAISAGIFFYQIWSTRTSRRSKLIATAIGIVIFGFCTIDAYQSVGRHGQALHGSVRAVRSGQYPETAN